MLDYNFITGLQKDIAALLGADETHRFVQIIREAASDRAGGVVFENAVNNALMGKVPVNGKVGLACLIFCPEGKPLNRSNTGLVVDFEITVRYVCNTSLNASPNNGTGISCEDILVEGMLLMQNWTPLRGHTLTIEDFGKVNLDKQPELWAWECVVKAHDAQQARPKCGLPRITPATDESGTTITVTTASADADLYYTLDGALPTPEVGIKYEVPFELTAPASLRVMAWQSGFLPSDCASLGV
jgi:hypothetical protein